MKRPSSSLSSAAASHPICTAAADFLRGDAKMAGILPAARRLMALQKECEQTFPEMFKACSALRLEEGQLTVSAPNAASAARFKQKLPFLQDKLNQAGWNINSIRVKVQMTQPGAKPHTMPEKLLSREALSALSVLSSELSSSTNDPLKKALADMINRHRQEEAEKEPASTKLNRHKR